MIDFYLQLVSENLKVAKINEVLKYTYLLTFFYLSKVEEALALSPGVWMTYTTCLKWPAHR